MAGVGDERREDGRAVSWWMALESGAGGKGVTLSLGIES